MPLPGTWNNVTVTATFLRADTGGPAAGSVYFEPQRGIGMDETIVLPNPITATLNGSGQITASLPCPDDPDAGHTTLVYKVTERVPYGRTYLVELDRSMTTVPLADITQVAFDPSYSLRGQDGRSAYEIALANGFVGTEPQWLASLEGDVTPEALAAQAAAEDAADAAESSASAAADSALSAAGAVGVQIIRAAGVVPGSYYAERNALAARTYRSIYVAADGSGSVTVTILVNDVAVYGPTVVNAVTPDLVTGAAIAAAIGHNVKVTIAAPGAGITGVWVEVAP